MMIDITNLEICTALTSLHLMNGEYFKTFMHENLHLTSFFHSIYAAITRQTKRLRIVV